MRPDNADLRLTQKAIDIGCASKERIENFNNIRSQFYECKSTLKSELRSISSWNKGLPSRFHLKKITSFPKSALEILSQHPDINLEDFATFNPKYGEFANIYSLSRRMKIEAIYHRIVSDCEGEMNQIRQDESLKIPSDLDYSHSSLSFCSEEIEKLNHVRPSSIGAASRIQGVTPIGLLSLLRYIRKNYDVV